MKTWPAGHRAVVTVLGPDQIGIIAAVSAVLAKNNVNILDISQTIMQDIFVMVLLADLEGAAVDLLDLKEQLVKKGDELKVKIDLQHENIFNFMHRI